MVIKKINGKICRLSGTWEFKPTPRLEELISMYPFYQEENFIDRCFCAFQSSRNVFAHLVGFNEEITLDDFAARVRGHYDLKNYRIDFDHDLIVEFNHSIS